MYVVVVIHTCNDRALIAIRSSKDTMPQQQSLLAAFSCTIVLRARCCWVIEVKLDAICALTTFIIYLYFYLSSFFFFPRRYIMESVDTHPCNKLFPKAAPDNDQACGYFRIRELSTGKVVSNVSQSIGHNFCSALADHKRDTLWVFCSAFARRNKLNPGPCAHGYNGCYVGGWKTKLSGDLNTWSRTAKVLTLPGGMGMANNDATLVSGAAAVAAALIPGAAPPHQAVMIIEGRGNWSRGVPYPEFAINTGTVRKALERERTLMREFSRRTPSVSSRKVALYFIEMHADVRNRGGS